MLRGGKEEEEEVAGETVFGWKEYRLVSALKREGASPLLEGWREDELDDGVEEAIGRGPRPPPVERLREEEEVGFVVVVEGGGVTTVV